LATIENKIQLKRSTDDINHILSHSVTHTHKPVRVHLAFHNFAPSHFTHTLKKLHSRLLTIIPDIITV